jgi:hypothetical protein
MRTRLVVLTVLVLALVGLMTLDGSPVARPATTSTLVPAGPVVPGRGATGSIWFCAAGSAATAEAPVHEVIVANPTPRTVRAHIVEVGPVTDTTSQAPSTAPPAPSTTDVPARSTVVLAVDAPGVSVQVELSAPGPVVSHRLVAGPLFDEAPCATAGSASWFLPSVNTWSASPQGAVAQLWLFNPFPSDASVDISVVSDDGVRRPSALSGIVVSGGTNRLVDVGSVVKLREQVALDVRTRAGLVVAELTQVNASPEGLRLTPGVPSTRTRLAFADGVVGPGIGEQYVVFNPTGRSASVLVQVVPYDADPSVLPEPFDLDVPARRFVVLDLDQQTRVPQDRPHWVRLESVNGVGVAVQRSVRITASNDALGLDSGFGSTTGASVAATRFTLPWADRSADGRSVLLVANPSVDTLAEVEVRAFGAGRTARRTDVKKVELEPGHGTTIDLGPSGASPRGLVVSATSPVVVERRVQGASGHDLAVIPAVPSADDIRVLPSMSHTVAAGTPSGS